MKRILLVFSLLFSLSFYGQNDTISVVRHTDNDFVIPKDLKLVYRGLPNEIIVDVPGAKSFQVMGNGITKKKENIYNLNPGEGSEIVISVNIVLKNNKRITEKHIFKIRNIKAPVTTINSRQGAIKISKSQLDNAIVRVIIPDKNLDLEFIVSGFNISLPNKELQVLGNKIDSKIFKEINSKVSKYDQIAIHDVKFTLKRGCKINVCKTTPIVIEIL